mgnify:CR=1 FL=1
MSQGLNDLTIYFIERISKKEKKKKKKEILHSQRYPIELILDKVLD